MKQYMKDGMTESKEQLPLGKIVSVSLGVLAVIIVIGLFNNVANPPQKKIANPEYYGGAKNEPINYTTHNSRLKIPAWVIAQNFVIAKLKAPSSADFPWYDESFVKDEGNNKYLVCAYVDAQNAFGAKLRNQWCCELSYNSGDENDNNNWNLLKLEFAGNN